MIPLFAIFLGLALSHLAAGQSAEVPSAGSVLDLLQDPKYQPFIQIVLNNATVCLSDPFILGGDFNLSDCPGIETLLEAVSDGTSSPEISCTKSCVDLFSKLEPGCSADLRDAFTKADGNIGKFASEYFDKCDSIDNSAQQMTSETSHGFTQKAIITLFAFITFILVL